MRLQDLIESKEEILEEDVLLEEYLVEEDILLEDEEYLLEEELLNEDVLAEAYVYKKNFTKFLNKNLKLGNKSISSYPSLNKVFDLVQLKKATKGVGLTPEQSRVVLSKATKASSDEISRKAAVRKKIESLDNELKQSFRTKEKTRIEALLTDIKKVVGDERLAVRADKKNLNSIKRGIKNRAKAVSNRVKTTEKTAEKVVRAKKKDLKAKENAAGRTATKKRINYNITKVKRTTRKAKDYAVDFSKTLKGNFAKKTKTAIARINKQKMMGR